MKDATELFLKKIHLLNSSNSIFQIMKNPGARNTTLTQQHRKDHQAAEAGTRREISGTNSNYNSDDFHTSRLLNKD